MKYSASWLLGLILLSGCSNDEPEPSPVAVGGGHAGATANRGGSPNRGGASSVAGRSNVSNGGVAIVGSAGSRTAIAGAGGMVGSALGGALFGGTSSSAPATSIGGGTTNGGTSSGGASIADTNAGATSGGATSGGASASSSDIAGSGGSGASSGSFGTASANAGAPASNAGTTGNAAGTSSTPGGATSTAGGAAGMAGTEANLGNAGVAGIAGTGNTPPALLCGSLRDSVVGWWSFEDSLASHDGAGPTLTEASQAVAFASGIASGRSLDVAGGGAVDATSPSLNVTEALTLAAFVRSPNPEGRVIDRISDGDSDGYMLDFHLGHLRLIVGNRSIETTNTYTSPNAFMHVAAVFTGGSAPQIRLFIDGQLVRNEAVAAGPIPSSDLFVRIGANRNGIYAFPGQIDEAMVIARALSDSEILELRNQLIAGQCTMPTLYSPKRGILLEHNESGMVSSGSVEHIRANIRNAGDLRVLTDEGLYTCDWNGMTAPTVSNCQAYAPFAVTTTNDSVVPVTPLEWRLFKFNTTGFVDELGMRVESSVQTRHQESASALTWLGRDWRVKRFEVVGTSTSGSLVALAEQLRGGAGLGVNTWGYALPHLTAVIALSGDEFAGLDPWHISTQPTNVAGEIKFQADSYHYGVWFDTTGYSWASRWTFGAPSARSTSSDISATAYFTEPGWQEVLATDASGAATSGAKTALSDAILNGARVRVATPEGYFDCNRVRTGTDSTCFSHDTFTPVVQGDGHVHFDATHSRRLRVFGTDGHVLRQDWSDHTATCLANAEETAALRWFVQSEGWTTALITDAQGNELSGHVADVVAAITSGADVMVGLPAASSERVVCDSLRYSVSPPRAACLAWLQNLGEAGGTTAGTYEARVYNTNGVLARAHVSFGATASVADTPQSVPLAWYVRRMN